LTSEHNSNEQTYEGVPVAEILKRAGVPQADQTGTASTIRVIAEGSDGYRATFTLAELGDDSDDSGPLVADVLDGQPIGGKLGPLRLVVPRDTKENRWVRMLRSITVVNPSK
jgi:DMSO/TMAO reductase YedYZ molybdopterin-dependent catalytic subunit